jgi:aldehyde dehydrogenase (NAD+)
VSAAQRERVLGLIDTAFAEGARLGTGGTARPAGLPEGHYVRPTVLGDVDQDSTVAQEEVFGPVLAVLRYRDEAEALSIANNTRYGLAGAVWAADQDRGIEFARRMETGSVDVNGGAYNQNAPFGGYKMSGTGRELGVAGLVEFTQTKAIQL